MILPRRPGSAAGLDSAVKMASGGTIMAAIFALPALGAFLGIYYSGGGLVPAAAVGFGMHFAILAFSGRISRAVSDAVD